MDPFISKTIPLRRVVVTGIGLITPDGEEQGRKLGKYPQRPRRHRAHHPL